MKKKYTEIEKQEYVRKLKSSGQSVEDFARNNKIGISTICRWRKKYPQEYFGKLELNNSETKIEVQEKTYDIVFATDNIELYLKEGYDKNILRNIVEVLSLDDCKSIRKRKSNIHSIWGN